MKTRFCFDHHNYGPLNRPAADSVYSSSCWTGDMFWLTDRAETDPDHMSRKWAEDPSTAFPHRHFSPSVDAGKKTPPTKTSEGGGQSAVVLDSTPRMLSLDLAAFSGSEPSTSQRHEARLGCKSSARHPASPSQLLSVTWLVSVHTLLEKCWANTEEQSQRLILLSH